MSRACQRVDRVSARAAFGAALGVCACALLLGCSAPGAQANGATGPSATGGAPAGPSAPDFSLPTLDGKKIRLSDLKGKVVLIDFWSTTCDPCMVEMPHLVALYKKHKDAGLVVLAVSLDGPESRAQVSAMAHDKEMIFPVLLDEETSVVTKFNPKNEMPFAVVVDRSGAVVHKRGGYTAGDEKTLASEIEKTLAK